MALTKSENASLNSETCSSVSESACSIETVSVLSLRLENAGSGCRCSLCVPYFERGLRGAVVKRKIGYEGTRYSVKESRVIDARL